MMAFRRGSAPRHGWFRTRAKRRMLKNFHSRLPLASIASGLITMIHKTIHGTRVPALGLGTWQLTGDACRDAVTHALEIGYRHIDTAQAYGNEEQVGRAIDEATVSRSDLFLTTKVWHTNLAPADVRASTDESLRKLRTDYVDLLLIHWPVERVPLEDTLDALVALRDAGKTRHIGVSNCTPTLVRRARDHLDGAAPLFANQVEYHPFLGQDALRALARETGHMLTAYSPLARGSVVTREASPRRALKALKEPGTVGEKARRAWEHLAGNGTGVLQAIGEAHGKSPAQVALRWLVQQDAVTAIPKAARPEHRAANIDIFDFELSDAEMQSIAALDQGERYVDPSFAPTWES